MRNQERAPRMYELMTVLHPDVPEESLQGELDRIAGYITAAGGDVIETLRDSPWGRRRLAYPIRSGSRDVRDGYYAVWHMNLGPARITDLERELKLNTQVIRYIVVSWAPKVLTEKEIEAAEIAAEDVAAAAYAAQVAAANTAAASAAAASAVDVEVAAEAVEIEVAADVAEIEAAADVAEAEAEIVAAAEPVAEAEAVAEAIAEVETGAIEAVAEIEERAGLMADAAAALEQEEAAAAAVAADAAETEAADDTPANAVRGDGTTTCPDDYPVKGNASSMLYHSPGSPVYGRTIAEFCFASTEAAEAAGFTPTRYEAAQDEAAADAE